MVTDPDRFVSRTILLVALLGLLALCVSCAAAPEVVETDEALRIPLVTLAPGYNTFTCKWTWLSDDGGKVPFVPPDDACVWTLEELPDE